MAYPVEINKTNFPDDIFRDKFSTTLFPGSEDGIFTEEEALKIENMILFSVSNLSLVEGIEYFPNLKNLTSDSSKLESLDLRNNKELFNLDIPNNPIKNLNINQNTKLDNIYAFNCNLSDIDISNCKELRVLEVSTNNLINIDTSQNTQLVSLIC